MIIHLVWAKNEIFNVIYRNELILGFNSFLGKNSKHQNCYHHLEISFTTIILICKLRHNNKHFLDHPFTSHFLKTSYIEEKNTSRSVT